MKASLSPHGQWIWSPSLWSWVPLPALLVAEDDGEPEPEPLSPPWWAVLASRLRDEAAQARRAPNGRHPEIQTMTHAAALTFAAKLVEDYGQEDE